MNANEEKPLVAIPMGDPAGVGPEITVKALRHRELYTEARPLVVGDGGVIRKALAWCGLGGEVNPVSSAAGCVFQPAVVNLLDLENVDREAFAPGRVRAECGRAAFEYIERAASLARSGGADGVATAPINKESLKAAKVPYIGHTEILAGLTGAGDPLTMFQTGTLRVFFFSRHVSLREAISLVKKERLLAFIERCCGALELLGEIPATTKPGVRGTIAVAGLNPHCGDGGQFGDEELTEISPAVQECKRRGLAVEGPIGADSVFHLALQGRYGAVVSLYHDQGHIACKTRDFDRTVSVTLGLPFLRTSVDHGTAFDIAGTGRANETGMVEAVLAAARYAPGYLKSTRLRVKKL